ncbi:MAG: hypothetical protein HYT73_04495 [Candidatus Aenigmarchaeota archaeon]|nr:hypothetical protein [Candidatus Aenigmarchaeota archaeon]
MTTEADYRRAQEDASYRQAFLDSLDLEDARPYVRRVIYRPLGDGDTSMKIKPSFLQRYLARRIRSDIRVYSRAFSSNPLYDDFLGVLIDHEGYHARELYKNPEVVVLSYLRLFLSGIEIEQFRQEVKRFHDERELRATMSQLAACSSGKRSFSDTYISCVCIEIEELCETLGVGVEFNADSGEARIVEPFTRELRRRL